MRPALEQRFDAFQATVQELKQVFGDRLRRVDGARDDELVLNEIRARLEGRPISTRLIISAPPGSGKGIQTQMVLHKFKIPHASSAELLRSAIASGSSLGIEAKAQLKQDGRVTESVLTKIVIEALTSSPSFANGWLLDGFPRTAVQVRQCAGRRGQAWADGRRVGGCGARRLRCDS